MSWTDIFPVFTDEMVDEFHSAATADEKAELEEWYGVEQVFNRQDKRHIASVSLFWKNVKACDPDLPEPTRDRMKRARELGLALRYDPWEHYVEPLLREVPVLRVQFPNVVFRVHLAKDLEFLVPDLVEAGCEVQLMKSSSIRLAPGALWRYLPLEEEGKLITLIDSDRVGEIALDIARTEAMGQSDLGVWRFPQTSDFNPNGEIRYTPFLGQHFGIRGGWPIKLLMQAFTWYCRCGKMNSMIAFPGSGLIPTAQPHWPDYGFDEWFLATALYPRVAASGVVTLVWSSDRSLLLTLDIEYVTWANPKSQLIYIPA
ncbi:MAG: hypothetical protein WCK77_20955 [Verrucomicrobiota bacterium]